MQNSNSISNTVYLTHAVDLTIGRRDITGPNQINSWALNTSQDPLMKFKMGLSPWQARHKKTVQLIAQEKIISKIKEKVAGLLLKEEEKKKSQILIQQLTINEINKKLQKTEC